MSIKPFLNVVGICRFPLKDINTPNAVEMLRLMDERFGELSGDLPVDLKYTTEVSFNSDDLSGIVNGVRDAGVEDVIVGTVTNTERLERANNLGIKKAVAPDFNSDVLNAAYEYHIDFVPGIMHVHEKRRLGEVIKSQRLPIPQVLKVFPFAGEKTAAGLLAALKAPYATEIGDFEAGGGKIRLAKDGEISHLFVHSANDFAAQMRQKPGQEIVIAKPYTGMDGLDINSMTALSILQRFDHGLKGAKYGAFGGVKLTDVGTLSKRDGIVAVGLGSDFLGTPVLQAAESGDFAPAISKVDAVIGSIRAAYTK